MTRHRFATTVLTSVLAVLSLTTVGSAQEPQQTPPPKQTPQPQRTPAPTPPPIEQRFERPTTRRPAQDPMEEVRRLQEQAREERSYRRPVLSLFQNYVLPQGETTRQVVSVLADVQIDGTVHGDVVVVMGTATLGPTAVVEGSLVVAGGSATIKSGAKVSEDVVVIGGTLAAPTDFTPGGEQVSIGTPVVGDFLRRLSPWLTRGLLLGRLIVPGIGWVWTIVFVTFLLGLILNQLFVRQVGACADTLVRRPGGSFFVGLLVMLLAGPAMAIVAVTVIGLPFALVALIAATMIGKLGVTRAIGRRLVSEGDEPTPGRAAISYVLGAAVITFAYMIPIVGLMTWALIGVFGLGTATMTFMASVRRERPVAPPAAPTASAPIEPPPSVPASAPIVDMPSSPYGATPFSEPNADVPPPVSGFAASDVYREAPPVPPPAATVPPPVQVPPPASTHSGAGLLAYPRATFLDRMAAIGLDAILVAIANNILSNSFFYHFYGYHNDGGGYLAMLLIYNVAFWAWKGTTLGGIICNLRMVRTTGEDPRFVDALVRGLTAIFSAAALGIGVFWMLNDPERQMWHDKVAGTVVLKVPRHAVLA